MSESKSDINIKNNSVTITFENQEDLAEKLYRIWKWLIPGKQDPNTVWDDIQNIPNKTFVFGTNVIYPQVPNLNFYAQVDPIVPMIDMLSPVASFILGYKEGSNPSVNISLIYDNAAQKVYNRYIQKINEIKLLSQYLDTTKKFEEEYRL
ncbi:MAG: hypothetical protein KQA40_02600 [Candidatus Aenigmarchaeota archaeon]|nr:hypothetical protein [Candidatus Aenigmarchaeota archaeon]